MQNKHLLVTNMAFSVKMACTQKLRKITWMEMMFTWSCVFKPQSSHVFKWTYNTLNMWQIQTKPRIWLSITWNHFYIPKQIGWYTTIGFGVDVLALKPKSNHLHLLETCYTGQQSLSTYCCTHQSLNHNLSKIQNLFRTFIKMMMICSDRGAFSTFYSKAISQSKDTCIMSQNLMVLLTKQSLLV